MIETDKKVEFYHLRNCPTEEEAQRIEMGSFVFLENGQSYLVTKNEQANKNELLPVGNIIPQLTQTINGIKQTSFEPGTIEFNDDDYTISYNGKTYGGKSGAAATIGIVAPEFDKNRSYSVGQYVIFENSLYRCKKETSPLLKNYTFNDTPVQAGSSIAYAGYITESSAGYYKRKDGVSYIGAFTTSAGNTVDFITMSLILQEVNNLYDYNNQRRIPVLETEYDINNQHWFVQFIEGYGWPNPDKFQGPEGTKIKHVNTLVLPKRFGSMNDEEKENFVRSFYDFLFTDAGFQIECWDKVTVGTELQTIYGLIDTLPKFKFEVVDELPAEGVAATIYLKRKTDTTSTDLYQEYIYVNNAWEFLGSQTMDLSNYIQRSDVDNFLDKYSTNPISNSVVAEAIENIATTKVSAMTQSDYDALVTKDENTFYLIVDEE